MTIPASAIVAFNPGVISGGGNAIALNGIILTNSTAVPIGAVQPFANPDAVTAFFGAGSTEAALAAIYFAGYDNKTVTPGNLFFSQYPVASVAAYVRGGSLSAMTLTQLQALTGTLIVTIDGVLKTSSTINLSAATSFSNAATIIAAGFSSLGGTVTWDSIRAGFVVTSSTTGATSTITACTGTLAASLLMSVATGAVLSQGAIAYTPSVALDGIKAVTLNWAQYMTTWEPLIADKLLFAAWANSSNKRFIYVEWDTDITATQSGNTTTLGPQLNALNSSGTVPFYGTAVHAAFVLGSIASVDFARTNGRPTFAFKSQSGLASTVTDQTIANNLDANGYNFYGSYATANQGFTFMFPGSVTGAYSFLDEYVNEVYMTSQMQLALMVLLTSVPSIPYNAQGYALIDAALMDPINAALNFGSIRPGVPLSSSQAAQVNNLAGKQIDTVLSSRGWYLQILSPTAQVRAARGTPKILFIYMDGGSVHSLNIASIIVQ